MVPKNRGIVKEQMIIGSALLFIVLIFMQHVAASVKREIKAKELSCGDECSGMRNSSQYKLIHITAKLTSSNDTIHYLISCIERPTIIIGHTTMPPTETSLKVNWTNLVKKTGHSVEFDPELETLSAMQLSRIIWYQDKEDKVDPFSSDNKIIEPNIIPDFQWFLRSSSSLGIAKFVANSTKFIGNIIFDVKAFAKEDNDEDWPHEPVNANSLRFSLTLDHLNSTKNSKHRFAVKLLFIKPKTDGENPSFITNESIDDENTPGIFKLWKLTSLSQSFASWKPVAYNEATRGRETQVFSHNFPKDKSGKLPSQSKDVPWSIASETLDDPQAYYMHVSFGTEKDGFYQKTKYTSWTGLVGYGKAPSESFSQKTIWIIIGGLGGPVALIVLAVLAMLFRMFITRRKTVTYERIN